MKCVDEVDAVSKKIGAISCVVVRPDGSLSGTNNDCYGFIHNIRQEQPGWRADHGPVLVIGAGRRSRALGIRLTRGGAQADCLLHPSLSPAQRLSPSFVW